MENSLKQRPVIISAALTGAATTRKHCQALPYTPVEIAIEAKRAFDAGATVVHIHAREDDGRPTWRVPVFEAIREEVEKLSPVLINFSTGGIGNTIEERTENLSLTRPHIAALNMGSMNYALYSEKKHAFLAEEIFLNPFRDIITCLNRIHAAGAKPELECFDAGHVFNANPLIDMGLLKPPIHFSFVLGVVGGIGATPECLKFMSTLVAKENHWQVIGISRDQWRLCEEALELGGHIRVGLEDNFYLPDGTTMARSNGELVEQAVQLVERSGRKVATLAQTKEAFGLALG